MKNFYQPYVFVLLLLLLLAGCHSTKMAPVKQKEVQQNNSSTQDSVYHYQKIIEKSKTIPQETAKLVLSREKMDSLPTGAGYEKKNGRAKVKITKTRDGTFEFESNCDSVVYRLTQEIDRLKEVHRKSLSEYTAKELITKPPNKVHLDWYLYGFISPFILYLIIRIRRLYTKKL